MGERAEVALCRTERVKKRPAEASNMNEFYGATGRGMASVNSLLKLSATGREQDWEFELADPERLSEMLDLLDGGALDAEGADALALLLIASMELAKEQEIVASEVIARSKKWFSENPGTRSKMIFYWIGMRKTLFPDLLGGILGEFEK